MAYEKNEWKNRQGVNLDKYTKYNETPDTVILTNTPDSLSEEGTAFTAERMNHIEQGIEDAHKNKADKKVINSVILPNAGWYRIATSILGVGRNIGQFMIHGTVSGQHQTCIIHAGSCYSGGNRVPELVQLSRSAFSTGSINQVRIVYHDTTYANNFVDLEIYNATANTVLNVELLQNVGWILQTPVAGGIPDGYTSLVLALTPKGIATTGPITVPAKLNAIAAASSPAAALQTAVATEGQIAATRAAIEAAVGAGGGKIINFYTLSGYNSGINLYPMGSDEISIYQFLMVLPKDGLGPISIQTPSVNSGTRWKIIGHYWSRTTDTLASNMEASYFKASNNPDLYRRLVNIEWGDSILQRTVLELRLPTGANYGRDAEGLLFMWRTA